jgi:hypothetical protein
MTGKRSKSGVPKPDAGLMPLLVTLGRFRCAGAVHLHRLALASASVATVKTALSGLVKDGWAQAVELPRREQGFALTEKALRGLPELQDRFPIATARVNEAIAAHGWQRAALWAAYFDQGYHVGCGPAALQALRGNRQEHLRAVAARCGQAVAVALWQQLQRELGDGPALVVECRACKVRLPSQQEHPAGSSERACDGPYRAVDGCPVDVAYNGQECVLLVADHPRKSIVTQLKELPVHVAEYDRNARSVVYLPKLPVVFIPCEDESSWDPVKQGWASRGPRLRQWASFTESGRGQSGFPYPRVLTNLKPPDGAVLFRKAAARQAFAHGVSACK